MIKHVWECFYFGEVLGEGEGEKKVLFLLHNSYNPSKTKRSTFLSSVLLRVGRCPSFAGLSFVQTNMKTKSMEH
jgi:hypothetical protein